MESNITLWQFLLELLVDENQYKSIITWTNNEGEFKLINAEEVAKLWGLRKNKHNMNYDKLSRALRYYYDKHIIKKVQGQKFVYRFVTNPTFSNPHHYTHPHQHQHQHHPLASPLLANPPHTPSSPLVDSQQANHLAALYQKPYAAAAVAAAHHPFASHHHHHNHHGNPFSAHLSHQASTVPSENEPTDLSRKTGSCSSVASSSSASASPTSTSPPTSPSSYDVNNNTIISDLINNTSTSTNANNNTTTNNTGASNTNKTTNDLASNSSSPSKAHKNKPKPPPISTASLIAAAAQQHSQQHTINKTLQTPNIQFASPFPRFNSSLNLNSPVHNSPLPGGSSLHLNQRQPTSLRGSATTNATVNGTETNGGAINLNNGHHQHASTTPSTPSTTHSLLSNPSLSLWSQFTNPLLSPLMMNHKHQQSALNGSSNNSHAKNGDHNKDANNNNLKSEINNNNTSPFNQSPHAFQFPAPAMAAAAAMSGATGQPIDECMSTILGSPLLSPLLFAHLQHR